MIIVRIHGGLGNQMFQYALGRNLSLLLETELKLDISWFTQIDNRQYHLGVFEIKQDIASVDEIHRFRRHKKTLLDRARAFGLLGARRQPPYHMLREAEFHYNPAVLKSGDNTYLDGYWQSQRYFERIAASLRKEFSIINEPSGLNRVLGEEIATANSVSVHVRRGDYISNPTTNAMHGACSVEYYLECIERIAQRLSSPHFYVFSDEPEWVKDNLPIPYANTIVDHNRPEQCHEDLRLISRCRHHILANSSFSWWGAWLNPMPEKIVYAPQRWFAAADMDTSTLLPEDWIRV